MDDRSDIAIIIAVYNGAAVINHCLQSIRMQSLRPREVIVVDGNSSDGTQDLVRDNGDIVTTLISEPDGGIYDAWNKGIAKASAEWVMFLGSDDILAQTDTLKSLASFAAREASASALVYGQVEYVDSHGELVERLGDEWSKLRNRMNFEMSLPHPGLLHRRSLFLTHGCFDTSYRIAGDYDLIRRIIKTGDPSFFPGVIVRAGVGGVSTRPGMILLSIREAGRVIERSDGRRPLRWYWTLAKGSAKYALIRVLGPDSLARIRRALKGA
jgi:glycosyltransferase involved in cell wall biosynthesis